MGFDGKYKDRKTLIDAVLRDLEALKMKKGAKNLYALNENITFFRSLYSYPNYLQWMMNKMSSIDSSRILELSDFGLPYWEKILQENLLDLEKKKPPDILKPLRSEILNFIQLHTDNSNNLVLVNVGSGAMEIERQVISELIKSGNKQPVVFFGVDGSQASINAAKENLSDLKIKKTELKKLSPNIVRRIRNVDNKHQIQVIWFKCDAFSLSKYFGKGMVDLLYHSKFKHHLPKDKKEKFDDIVKGISKKIIEFDDHKGLYLILFSSLFNWNKPILMNGATFSWLRLLSRKQLNSMKNDPKWKTKILMPGGYLRIYN